MKHRQLPHREVVVAITLAFCVSSFAAARADDADLVQLVIDLLVEQDKDLRALALEQVRTEAQGEAATRRFAAELPKLPPDGQVGLLRALADRGDKAARPAVLNMLKTSQNESVRVAAIGALGGLGEQADLPLLGGLLAKGPQAEQDAARTSLVRMPGQSVSAALGAEMKRAAAPVRVALIEILATRRALDTIPDLLSAAIDADPKVRVAAMIALGQIAGPEHVPGMVQAVLKAEPGREREAAEKAILLVCGRVSEVAKRDDTLLAAIKSLNETDQITLLPTLGRVGGTESLKVIEAAIAKLEPQSHESGLRALCNWPDASVAPRLIELAQTDEHSAHRTMALAALIRIAPLPDGRPDRQRLKLVHKVMGLCDSDEQRNLLLKRVAAIRTVETLRFILPYLDRPPYAEQACESIVELAHHRGLREPNKAEFHQALDKVIEKSKDAVVIDRANRYKKDQTWVRPTATKPSKR